MKDRNARLELNRLKLRLFGEGNTDCLNVRTSDRTDSILGGHRERIFELETQVKELQLSLARIKRKRK